MIKSDTIGLVVAALAKAQQEFSPILKMNEKYILVLANLHFQIETLINSFNFNLMNYTQSSFVCVKYIICSVFI